MPVRAEQAGRLLADAWRTGRKIAGLGQMGPTSRAEAFAVQAAMASDLGLEVGGWKVGAATQAILEKRRLEGPIAGPIYASHVYGSPAELPAADFPEANLECEFSFRLLEALPPGARPYGPRELSGAVVAHAAFDLTQSRFLAPPDEFSEIADSGNSGGAVIGPEIPDWRERDLLRAGVSLRVDGGAPSEAYSGRHRRDPLDVLCWLVASLRRRGIRLERGWHVLTGSVTEPRRLGPGSSAVARFEGAGLVTVAIGDSE